MKKLLLLLLATVYLSACGKKAEKPVKDVTYTVSTLAGGPDNQPSYMNGVDTNATFDALKGITIDASGNLYVIDRNRIKKVTQTGVVVTFVGSANPTGGFADGIGVNALFNNPKGITIDNAGNLFVSDYGNSRIRKITPGGVVSTVAGNGQYGAEIDGSVAIAQIAFPRNIAIDASGNLYVTDDNSQVRKITPAGIVSTLNNAKTYGIEAITSDATGNIYAATFESIYKFPPLDGAASFIAGGAAGFSDGTGQDARFNFLTNITHDGSGNLYLSDATNLRIRKVTLSGIVTTIAGNGKYGYLEGPALNAEFFLPSGLVTDAVGNIYVCDMTRVRKLTKQ
ncbi:MAG TPA: hypothetical protein VGN20_18280 [Mucilaginibacter sp.]|jgi:sugar lactone lactonase YvrE